MRQPEGTSLVYKNRAPELKLLNHLPHKRVQLLNWLSLKALNSLRFPYNDYAILNFSVAGVHASGMGVVIVEDGRLGAIKIENECNIIGNRWWKALFQGKPIWSNWFEGHQVIEGQSEMEASFCSLFSCCQRWIIRVDDGVGRVDLQIFGRPCKKKKKKDLGKNHILLSQNPSQNCMLVKGMKEEVKQRAIRALPWAKCIKGF